MKKKYIVTICGVDFEIDSRVAAFKPLTDAPLDYEKERDEYMKEKYGDQSSHQGEGDKSETG